MHTCISQIDTAVSLHLLFVYYWKIKML